MEWLNFTGALVTIGYGILGLFFPKKAARMVGLEAKTKAGFSEFRATYGGVWLFMGLFALYVGDPYIYAVVGLAWLGAACGRVFSIIIDKAATRQNWIGVGVELLGAALLLVGEPITALTRIF